MLIMNFLIRKTLTISVDMHYRKVGVSLGSPGLSRRVSEKN